jgi:hypothetical protein
MELLIPGLILVALMAYVSTRIKRSAARAFETETIEGDGFTIVKPDGFLHRMDENTEYAFEAYSKDFGRGLAENVRAANSVVIAGRSGLDEAVAIERSRLSDVEESEAFELGEAHCVLLQGELLRDGHPFQVFTKILQREDRTFTLRIEVLKELTDDFTRRIDEMILSFNPN